MSRIRIVKRDNIYIIQKWTDLIFGLWPGWSDWPGGYHPARQFRTLAEAESFVDKMLHPEQFRDVVMKEYE